MSAPRLEIDLAAIAGNTRHLVDVGFRQSGLAEPEFGEPG